jgi:ATP-dependent Lon protease
VIQNLSKIGTRNPLFLLDEIDKMAADFRGDPASALLEVLDPEQNHTFSDHYLEVDFDLSDVMFVATANTMNIPAPLLDRMEVIRLPGYTEDEKVAIARNYLLPKQMENNGLNENELQISQSALHDIVRYYTREAGVRGIEREIAKICRKVVKRMVLEPKTPESKTPESKTPESKTKATSVTSRNIEKYLGVKRFRYGVAEDNDQVGQVNGLAWTEVGGELLTIEAAVMPGKGKLSITGQLGDVMQESIQAAMTVIRSRSAALGLLPAFQEDKDIHVHVPEGATPKDGPSAGVGMCTALASALTGIPVRASVAMTGEITLRGEILPIGGLKEKLLAAHRAGIATVLIPHENEKDLVEMPKNILAKLDVKPVRWIDEVLELALQKLPTPLEEATASSRKTSTKGKKSNDTLRHH